jgi:hypothetical protein
MALAAAEMATMGGGAMMGELGRARRRRRRREWRGRGGGEEALSSDDARKPTRFRFFSSFSRLSHDAFDVLIGSF